MQPLTMTQQAFEVQYGFILIVNVTLNYPGKACEQHNEFVELTTRFSTSQETVAFSSIIFYMCMKKRDRRGSDDKNRNP